MKLKFDQNFAQNYKSNSQKIRVLSENWVDSEIFCPNCGCNVDSYENGKPVADFYCSNCSEDYELKSKKDSMGAKIADGAYNTMIERLQSANNPNFFFLNYNVKNYEVLNFVVIPKHFFVPEIIIKRSQGIKDRPNYIMCSIDLSGIPKSGKIFYIKDRKIERKEKVLENWQKTLFLRKSNKIELRGWILDIMKCIDKLKKNEFTLEEVYAFENLLSKKYQDNKHIKDKIRQQLQFLRDKDYLKFLGNGKYKLL